MPFWCTKRDFLHIQQLDLEKNFHCSWNKVMLIQWAPTEMEHHFSRCPLYIGMSNQIDILAHAKYYCRRIGSIKVVTYKSSHMANLNHLWGNKRCHFVTKALFIEPIPTYKIGTYLVFKDVLFDFVLEKNPIQCISIDTWLTSVALTDKCNLKIGFYNSLRVTNHCFYLYCHEMLFHFLDSLECPQNNDLFCRLY